MKIWPKYGIFQKFNWQTDERTHPPIEKRERQLNLLLLGHLAGVFEDEGGNLESDIETNHFDDAASSTAIQR